MSTCIKHRERVGSVNFPAVTVHLDRESRLSEDLTHVTEHHTNHIVVQFGHGETAFYAYLSMAAAEDLRDALKAAQERWTEPVEPLPAWERELLERSEPTPATHDAPEEKR